LTHGFLTYYVAGQALRDGAPGKRLYDNEWFAARMMEVSHGTVTDVNINPPTLAVAWVPVAYLSAEDSLRLWIVLSVLCLALSLWLIAVELGWSRRLWAIVAMSTLLTLAAPTREQIALGQMYAAFSCCMSWAGVHMFIVAMRWQASPSVLPLLSRPRVGR
jgi:hypothetical protein